MRYQRRIESQTRAIELLMRKDMVVKTDEINWDGESNPIKYIIDKKFYTIEPTPTACTTLYTDYNITSSKVITADNITTMASDLNMVANQTDILTADLDALKSNIANYMERVKLQEEKTQHLKDMAKGFAVVIASAGVFQIGVTLMEKGIENLEYMIFRNKRINGYHRLSDSGEIPLEDLVRVEVETLDEAAEGFNILKTTNEDDEVILEENILSARFIKEMCIKYRG